MKRITFPIVSVGRLCRPEFVCGFVMEIGSASHAGDTSVGDSLVTFYGEENLNTSEKDHLFILAASFPDNSMDSFLKFADDAWRETWASLEDFVCDDEQALRTSWLLKEKRLGLVRDFLAMHASFKPEVRVEDVIDEALAERAPELLKQLQQQDESKFLAYVDERVKEKLQSLKKMFAML